MKNNKFKKSTWIPLIFTIYSIVIYAYLLPRSTSSLGTKILAITLNVLIILALWWLYRKKEKMASDRERDLSNRSKSDQAD